MQPELYPSLSHAVTTACIQKHNGAEEEKETDRVGVLAVAHRRKQESTAFSAPGLRCLVGEAIHSATTINAATQSLPAGSPRMRPLSLLCKNQIRIDQTAAHLTKEIPRFSVPLWSPCPILPNRKWRETQRNIKEKWVAPVVYMYCKSEQNGKKDDRAQHEGTKSSLSQHRAIRDLPLNFWFKHMSKPARM